MKKLLLIGAAFAALLAPAMAAEKPVRVYKRPGPVVVAAPVYTWTGWYVGGNVGYSGGDAKTDLAGNGTVVSTPNFLVFFNSPIDFAASNTTRLNGVIGGGQIGYNYQFSQNWVVGFEADFQGSGERGSGQFTAPFSGVICFEFRLNTGACVGNEPFNDGTALTAYEAKINWFGTVRGRLGVLVGNQLLIYGTGGLAYGRVGISGSTIISGGGSTSTLSGNPLTGSTSFSASKTNVGFSVGSGIEGRFSYWLPSNWSWKLEYLYLDLGSIDTTTPFALATITSAGFFGSGTITTHTHFTDNIVRVGLNYKFGNYAPVVTK